MNQIRMITSSRKFIYSLLVGLYVIVSLSITVFSAIVLRLLLSDFSFTGLFGLLFFVLIGLGGLLIGLGSIRKIVINPKGDIISVYRFSLVRMDYARQEVSGCRGFTFRNNWGVSKAFLVGLHSGRQFDFAENAFNNYAEAIDEITRIAPQNRNIKRNLWAATDRTTILIVLGVAALVYALVLSRAF